MVIAARSVGSSRPTKTGAPRKLSKAVATARQAASPAGRAYKKLVGYIRHFEAELDPAHEVAMGFAGGEAGTLRIEGIGYSAPDILTFYGRDDNDARTQLVQHVSQLAVILRAVPVRVPDAPPRRIGFRLQEGWQGGDAGDASA